MNKLPYSHSTADPSRAQRRIREMLLKFGVDRVAFDENFKEATLSVMFKYKDFPVCLPINYGELAEIYLKEDPWTDRKFKTEDEWRTDKKQIAYKAAFSILEDFLKSLIMVVEMEIFSFEEIFLSYFTNFQGQRLGEVMVKKLPEFIGGRLALEDGTEQR
jgi:hypothetical protein